MFTEKEVCIVKALVEEEMLVSRSSRMDKQLSRQYLETLGGIEEKLGCINSYYNSCFRSSVAA